MSTPNNHTILCSRLFALSLLLVSCGKTGVTEEDFDSNLREAATEKLSECCDEVGASYSSDLSEYFVAFWGADRELEGVVYDPKKAEECIQALQKFPCAVGAEPGTEVCDEVYSGTFAPGAPCTSSRQCEPPRVGVAYCETDSLNACEQIVLKSEGETCGVYKTPRGFGNHGGCVDDLYCNANSICQQRREAGASCDKFDACARAACEDGICREPSPQGVCGEDVECTESGQEIPAYCATGE